MMEEARRALDSPVPWVALAGVMGSGTVALVGFWITFSGYHDANVARLATLETIVQSNTTWRVEQEREHKELIERVGHLEGELDSLIADRNRRTLEK